MNENIFQYPLLDDSYQKPQRTQNRLLRSTEVHRKLTAQSKVDIVAYNDIDLIYSLQKAVQLAACVYALNATDVVMQNSQVGAN